LIAMQILKPCEPNFGLPLIPRRCAMLHPYHTKYKGTNDCPIVQAATAYMIGK
jgi:hypothetical protein